MSNSELDLTVGLDPTLGSKYTPQGDGNQSDLIEHVLVSSHGSSRSKSRSSQGSKGSKGSKGSQRSRSSHSDIASRHMEECEKFIEVLTDVLEQPDNIDASIYCANPEEIQDDCDDFYVFINVYNKNTEEFCAYIKYIPSDKVIHIEEILRCSGEILPEQGSGTDIVRNLIAVGNEFRQYLEPGSSLSIMIDSDQSKITVKENEFELGWLYIFATGETWYNSLGFREEEYDSNTEFINDFIDTKSGKTTIREQFQKIKRELRNPDIRVTIVQKYKKLLKDTQEKFYKSLDKGVKDGIIGRGQFRTKFSNIKYDYPISRVGFGLKNKKGKKSKKNKGKKRRMTRKR